MLDLKTGLSGSSRKKSETVKQKIKSAHDLNFYFDATWALLEDFEIFDNFDHIFKAFSIPKGG